MNIRLTPSNYTLHGLVLQYLFRMILVCFYQTKKHLLNWWAMRDLNLRPRHYQ